MNPLQPSWVSCPSAGIAWGGLESPLPARPSSLDHVLSVCSLPALGTTFTGIRSSGPAVGTNLRPPAMGSCDMLVKLLVGYKNNAGCLPSVQRAKQSDQNIRSTTDRTGVHTSLMISSTQLLRKSRISKTTIHHRKQSVTMVKLVVADNKRCV